MRYQKIKRASIHSSSFIAQWTSESRLVLQVVHHFHSSNSLSLTVVIDLACRRQAHSSRNNSNSNRPVSPIYRHTTFVASQLHHRVTRACRRSIRVRIYPSSLALIVPCPLTLWALLLLGCHRGLCQCMPLMA